jgi:hypothetical protein
MNFQSIRKNSRLRNSSTQAAFKAKQRIQENENKATGNQGGLRTMNAIFPSRSGLRRVVVGPGLTWPGRFSFAVMTHSRHCFVSATSQIAPDTPVR